MAAIPETVYARDGDVHLAYQIVGDRGPDLLFVPTATFPIDLLWDEPTVARPPTPAGVVQPPDRSPTCSGWEAPMRCRYTTVRRCRPGPMGWSRCSTPRGANARRSSLWRSRRFPPCSWQRAIPSACAHWCSGARSRASSAPPTNRSGCRSRPWRGMSRHSGMRRDRCDRRIAGAQLGGRCGEAALVGPRRAAGRRPRILQGDLRPVPAHRRAARAREHPGADVDVAPSR